jgi:quercetin dioxygenase-like cupin family protein
MLTMFKVSENEKEYRFGDSGPKYLMRGPRIALGVVRLNAGQDFKKHYHPNMEENFLVIEGNLDIYVGDQKFACSSGDFVHAEPLEPHYLVNNSNAPAKVVFIPGPFMENDKVEVD